MYESTSENVVDLNDLNYKVAVSFEGYRDRKLKSDTKYVRWIFRMAGYDEGLQFEKILPHHKCTDDDYDSFYTINPTQKSTLDAMRNDPERGFYCIDLNQVDAA